MPSLRGVSARAVAEARAARYRRSPGVRLGRGVRLGPGVVIAARGGGRVSLGDRVEVGGWTSIVAQPGGSVVIGDDVFIAGLCVIAAAEAVEIGAESMLAEMVCVRDHDHDPDAPPRSGRMLVQPVRVGVRCWLGSKSSVVRGGQVGDDVVVGAHALVNAPVPAGTLAVGVPARVARVRRLE